jgi:hypothetical protein
MADAATALPLDYAPPRSYLRRRWKRLAVLTLLIASGVAAYARRADLRTAYDRYQYLRLQSRCLTFAPPADRVVYDETPDAAARLADPEYVSDRPPMHRDEPTPVLWRPRAFTDFWPTLAQPFGAIGDAAIIFMHDRASPSGRRGLIFVTVAVRYNLMSRRQYLTFEIIEIQPATWGAAAVARGGNGFRLIGPDPNTQYAARAERLRVFAGQADPSAPSHFTFDYELGGKRGTVDGWVRERVNDHNGNLTPGLELVHRAGNP